MAWLLLVLLGMIWVIGWLEVEVEVEVEVEADSVPGAYF